MTEESDIAAGAQEGTEPGEAKTSNVEDTARRMGWRPKEEFRGDPEKWRPAEEYVEVGLNELPVLRDRYRTLDQRYEKDVGDLKGKVAELTSVLKEFREFASKSEQRAYDKALKELTDKRDAAVAHADTETFKQTQAEIDALNESARETGEKRREQEPPKKQPEQPQIDPYVNEWVRENSWFETDKLLKNTAVGIHQTLIEDQPQLSLRENLARVKEEITKRFPEKFENQRRAAPPAVAESTPAPSRKKAKGYGDLPPDAKAACDRFVKSIPGFTKEQYIAQYFGGEE